MYEWCPLFYFDSSQQWTCWEGSVGGYGCGEDDGIACSGAG
jgi:hypothetical protein